MQPILATVRRSLLVAILATLLVPGYAPADQTAPQLDALFDLLNTDISQRQADWVTGQIWQHWLQTQDAKLHTLMQRGLRDMHNTALPAALKHFTQAIKLAPQFAEAWNKRATVYYLLGQYPESAADVAQTLKLEPRHFGALSGQGMIYLQQNNTPAALQYLKRALAINPYMQSVRKTIQRLEREINKDLI